MVRYKNTKNTGTYLESVQHSSLVGNVVSHVDLRDIIFLFHGLFLSVYMSCLYVIYGMIMILLRQNGFWLGYMLIKMQMSKPIWDFCESKFVGGYRETLENGY